MAFVTHRFKLEDRYEERIRSLTPKFGYNGFGELVFYRTYSRICCHSCRGSLKYDKGTKTDYCPTCMASVFGQEHWPDVVIRVTNGTFSIRKDWFLKNQIHWDEAYWQEYASRFALSMFKMEWLPPGRGMWAMGSEFVYERGSMALYNCAYTDITTNEMDDDISWLMDSLMHGVGVGYGPIRDDAMELHTPRGKFDFVIPDSREGWTDSVKYLMRAYLFGEAMPRFNYDEVRGPGMPIRGFGGVSSGPAPLMDLHNRIIHECEIFKSRKEYDSVYFKANIPNHVGVCVVAGNVRRSAELMKGKVNDPIFMDLKDYRKFPEREAFGWMSNNSVELSEDEDFMRLGEIAQRIIRNGEPGYINRQNMPFGRIGKKMRGLRKDKAVGFNPCGEIPLEHREVCNVDETLPTMCDDVATWLNNSCEFAAIYCTTVSLLPTHQHSTNRVVARNRRIGVSIIDISGWKHENGVHKITHWMREGYEKVVKVANAANDAAGIPRPIRYTTVKPGGTGPKLPGKTPGMGSPTFRHTLRRIRIAKNSPIHTLLVKANIPHEEDRFDKYTDCFEYPILQGPSPPAEEVSLWEQGMNLILVQREWADNAVSNTLYFKPMWPLTEKIEADFGERLEYHVGVVATSMILCSSTPCYVIPERMKIIVNRNVDQVITEIKIHEYNPHHEENHVEPVLSAIAPLTKSVSVLPHSAKGVYIQTPEEGLTEEEYYSRLATINKVDWLSLRGSDGQDEMYCTKETCEAPTK